MDSLDRYWKEFIEKTDEDCFSVIYEKCTDTLFSYGVSMGFQKEPCKDAIQDIFYQLYISKDNLTHVQNITAYIFKVFKHRLLHITCKTKEEESIDLHTNLFTLQVTALDFIIDSERKEIIKNKIELLLNSLSNKQKEVVYLKYIIGLQHKEISQILGIREDSARKQLYRAIEQLRKFASENNLPNNLPLILFFSLTPITQ